MQDVEIIGMLKSYIAKTLVGMGALKGAPCTVKSVETSGGDHVVTLEWTDTNGDKQETEFTVSNGTNGTNGTDGTDGFSPTIVVKTSTDNTYILTITDKNGSYDTPNLRGGGGGGGASSMADLTDVVLTSLAAGDLLVYDAVNGKWINSDVLKDLAEKVTGATNGNFAGLDASGNLIDSGKKAADFATAQALADEASTRSALGAKNLLPNIASSGSYASSGTVTKNANGSLTIDGTFDAVTTINIDYLNALSDAVFDVTDLIGTDIAVTFLDTAVSGITLQVGYFNSEGTRSGLETVSTKADFTFPVGAVKSATYLRIASGTYENVIVYPMMRLAIDANADYQPFAKTNKQLTDEQGYITEAQWTAINTLYA